ncbi:MAG: F0F1 ATP synthase subunit A [Bacteroidales bacterium]|nr:F0F1 ATP synthase subunit A [Bacteroidales bacterium]
MIVRTLSIHLIFLLFILPMNVQASLNDDTGNFNPGESIIDYILDKHEWQIARFGSTNIAVPLPILLISEGRLYAFMSSRFRQGTADWRGFRLMQSGDHKGRIVRVDTQGNISPDLPFDFSITKNVFSMLLAAMLLFFMFMKVSKAYQKLGSKQAPTGFQNAIEPIILLVRNDIAKQMLPAKHVDKYLPYLLTLFFFILFLNLMGLIPIFPGGANVTGNIAVTLGLALLTLVSTLIAGKRAYLRHLIDFPGVPWWLKFPIPIMPVIEIIGVLLKPVTLTIRLMANMMAGKIVIVSIIFLIFILGEISPTLAYGFSPLSIIFVVFVTCLKLLISVIQAFVFTLLTALYFGFALEEVDHAEEHKQAKLNKTKMATVATLETKNQTLKT